MWIASYRDWEKQQENKEKEEKEQEEMRKGLEYCSLYPFRP